MLDWSQNNFNATGLTKERQPNSEISMFNDCNLLISCLAVGRTAKSCWKGRNGVPMSKFSSKSFEKLQISEMYGA
jgi:hypothetical protein